MDEDDFHSQTPIGDVEMRNIIAKIPGEGQGIILLLTHYDTARNIDNFVGANDGGSSTGLMLEMARLLCGAKKGRTPCGSPFSMAKKRRSPGAIPTASTAAASSPRAWPFRAI